MKVLIVEDETPAAEQLAQFVRRYDSSVEIVDVLDSVDDSVEFLSRNPDLDLIFLDIHLSDGSSFDIFNDVKVCAPIIFTTAYDQYAIKAFKVNSIDYLLKPIKYEDLSAAIDKFHSLRGNNTAAAPQSEPPIDLAAMQTMLQSLTHNYKKRFLIKAGEVIRFTTVEEIAYIYAEGKITYLVDNERRKFIIDYTLEELESLLDPKIFFRANRKIITKISSIRKIVNYQNSRLKITVHPEFMTDIIISREKTPLFQKWLDR